MKKEIADKWVAALRSGDYKQGEGTLRFTNDGTKETSFCCLGVLCDISGLGKFEEQFTGYSHYAVTLPDGAVYSSSGDLPKPVIKWAGMKSSDGQIDEKNPLYFKRDEFSGKLVDADEDDDIDDLEEYCTLIDLNDAGNATFEQIADIIEKNWEKL